MQKLLDALSLDQAVWIDIGGGTGRNLEFFPVDVIRRSFKAIYGSFCCFFLFPVSFLFVSG